MANKNTQPRMFFRHWSYRCENDENYMVLPDGCRDLLVVEQKDGRRQWRFTDWDMSPRHVSLNAGSRIEGYRLKPGLTVDQSQIDFSSAGFGDFPSQLEHLTSHVQDIADIVDALVTPRATLQMVARQAGVSKRTLQRRFGDLAMPPPDFWRLLGRARRTVLALSTSTSLAELAVESGYSDQAHMTREIRRWFGFCPNQLRNTRSITEDISAPGLGNW